MITLMLVDDHAMFREGLRARFHAEPEFRVVGEADSAAALLARLPALRPNVIVLDLKLPDSRGADLIARVRAACPGCKIVVLTMFDHERYARAVLQQGADGFVVKGAPFDELADAVREVVTGRPYIAKAVADQLAGAIRRGRVGARGAAPFSRREREVLEHLARGLTVRQVAEALRLSEKTVATYKSRIMQKARLADHAALLRFAVEAVLHP